MRAKSLMMLVLCLVLVSASAAIAQRPESQARQGGKVFDVDPNLPGPPRGPGVELVTDGSFEAGTPNPNWGEESTNFGTPICSDAVCGSGGGTGPNTGTYWAWFGGIGAPEASAVFQNIQGDASATCTLSFYLEIPVASGNGTDNVEAMIDGSVVWNALESAAGFATYSPVAVDVSGDIDGTVQTLRFQGEISGTPGLSNFFVDDVSVDCDDGPPPPVPTAPSWAMLVLALMLVAGAMWSWKRQQA